MRNGVWILIMLAASAMAQAQRANLSGTWKLNVEKSFMGGDHPFSNYELTKKIVQNDSTIAITDIAVHPNVVNIPLPDSTSTLELALDGKEHEVQLPSTFPGSTPPKARVTAMWQGCTLEVEEFIAGFANYSKQRLFLSEDGSELIDLVEQHANYGDAEQRLVFEKAP